MYLTDLSLYLYSIYEFILMCLTWQIVSPVILPIFCISGIVAGSPCPPEVVRKVINNMGMKEMLVSSDSLKPQNMKIFS